MGTGNGRRTALLVASLALLALALYSTTSIAEASSGSPVFSSSLDINLSEHTKLALAALAGLALLPIALRAPWYVAALGLLLASSDRFLAFDISDLSLKPSYVLFSAALGGVAVRHVLRIETADVLEVWRRIPIHFRIGMIGLLVLHAVATIPAQEPTNSFKQAVVYGVGAGFPFLAIIFAFNTRDRANFGVASFVGAQVFVALYALYEFVAHYAGLPVLFAYGGELHGLARLRAFTYEPGYYALYIVSAIPLVMNDALSNIHRFRFRSFSLNPIPILLLILLVLALTNSRAGYISFAVTAPCVFLVRGGLRLPEARRLAVGIGALVTIVVATSVVTHFNLNRFVDKTVQSTVDTRDPASNLPRLLLYHSVMDIIQDNPVLGVGPGNFGVEVVRRNGLILPEPRTFPTNNIWLQEVVDKGVLALPFLALAVAGVGSMLNYRYPVDARMLALGALAVIIIHGSLASQFWDMRLWTVLGLAIVATRLEAPPQRGSP